MVTLPDGSTVNNPLRVISNGKGSELIFTLFWMSDRTEEEFNQDAKAVESDLQTVKRYLKARKTTTAKRLIESKLKKIAKGKIISL